MVIKLEFRIGEVLIITKVASITDEVAEALVNPANSYMRMGGGVAGALKKSGGAIIELEALKYAPVPIGKAVATTAGSLKAKFVIHAPTMEIPGPTNPENIYKATRAALICADELGVKTIAFPAMGTGVGGVPIDEAVRAMIKAITDHLSLGSRIRRITILSLDEETVNQFNAILEEYSKRP
ncbi:MAG: macro domain-containing protein [Candidatus Bathyarchaeia archaeon]